MGVRVWLPRSAPAKTAQPEVSADWPADENYAGPVDDAPVAPTSPSLASAPEPRPSQRVIPDAANLDWDKLAATVARCQACELHRGRSQTVFGTGDRSAQWMVIGEAPGAEEDRQGEPFVGRAGQLLNSMLLAAGFKRSEVYIANIVKCRPPDNRDPRPDEAKSCSSYLARQIALVNPKIILAVGRVAAQRLLQSETPVGKMRGKLHRYGNDPGIPVVVTYHPAYLLRSPREKPKVWQDLLFALEQSSIIQ
ncbi:MAG: uracil-DNA glycosylase [Gammaproteobacteria bacterium]|nr:uracil-DNA glycosylase [Gammaproteobacteria bacterium]